MKQMSNSFRVATYNVHRCRGTDGRYDPQRILKVLQDIDADVVGLQEVDTGVRVPLLERRRHPTPPPTPASPIFTPLSPTAENTSLPVLDYLCQSMGCEAVEGMIRSQGDGKFGNVILTRHPVKAIRRIDLTLRGSFERRGALDVDLDIRGKAVRVIVAHLGLEIMERYFQVSRLMRALGPDRSPLTIVMGDFNLLLSMLPKLRRFTRRMGHAPVFRTFPSFFPILPLDRIWAQPAHALRHLSRHETPPANCASDHLPLVATIGY